MSFKSKVLHMISLCVVPIFLMTGCGGEQEAANVIQRRVQNYLDEKK